MSNRTGIIEYNLHDRGRTHSGTERNYDVQRIVRQINSPEFQERVKNRDVCGYWGHWPRKVLKLKPGEGGLLPSGKPLKIFPACVTVSIEALPDGTVRHEQEFLETTDGAEVQKMNASKYGGFSQVIDLLTGELVGLDYVGDPNYTDNRAYSMDSADDVCLSDAIVAMKEEEAAHYKALADEATARLLSALDHASELQAENSVLLDMMAEGKDLAAMDSADGSKPVQADKSAIATLANDIAAFDSAELEQVQTEEEDKAKKPDLVKSVLDGFGLGRLLHG